MEEYNKSYGANNHTSLLSHAQSQSPPNTAIDATQDCHGGAEHTPKSSRKTSKLKWPIAYYYDERKERLFYLLLHILFLLDTIGTFIEFLICMYVIFVLSTIRFVITRLGMPLFSSFCNNSRCCCWQFHCLQKYNFCYQTFSVKARCNQPLSVF